MNVLDLSRPESSKRDFDPGRLEQDLRSKLRNKKGLKPSRKFDPGPKRHCRKCFEKCEFCSEI